MRATWTIVLAVCAAIAGVRPHHVRRAHPNATVAAHVAAHHPHARARHRTATTVAAIELAAANDAGAIELVTTPPTLATDRAAIAPSARGPPIA